MGRILFGFRTTTVYNLLTLTPWVFLLESILNPPKSTNFVTHKMPVSWIHQNPPVWSVMAERSSLPDSRTQVLVLAAECGFESRPWHLCPWARHLIIIASLHPGVKWYLWGQSWLISPICAVMAAIELYMYIPQGAEMVSGMMYEPYEQG